MNNLNMAFFGLFNVILFLVWMGISIYLIILMVRLMRRGIVALDLYIEKERRSHDR